MPDKKDFELQLPCDGRDIGGTCDISAWDAFYLAVFWELNTVSWTVFYFHWKHLALWQGTQLSLTNHRHILWDGFVTTFGLTHHNLLMDTTHSG